MITKKEKLEEHMALERCSLQRVKKYDSQVEKKLKGEKKKSIWSQIYGHTLQCATDVVELIEPGIKFTLK